MLLYTLVPMEAIFDEEEEHGSSNKKQTLSVAGVMLEVQQASDSEFEVVKLISSNPAHYLDSRFQPGKIITLKPQWD
jgi:hypothetical protein